MSGKVLLERALSKLGLASRTQTRQWVLKGRLKVNGKVVFDPAFLVTPEKDRFTLDGKTLTVAPWQTVMLNKPKGYVTTKRDEKNRKTVFDLLPPEMQTLHPVGRLDMHTTGLLFLTNDTKLSNHLTDPIQGIERTYVVSVEGKISDESIAMLLKGVMDDGELLKARQLTARKVSNRESHLLVVLTEGKNREIRRMFKAVGHEVISLKRIAFGGIALGELESGQYRNITQEEIRVLGGF